MCFTLLTKKANRIGWLDFVDYTPKLSNLFEDLKKLVRFAKSIGPVNLSDSPGREKAYKK